MAIQVTILGSGAALPTSSRNPSGQYVNCNDRHILIDCGEGTQNQLRKYGIKLQKITHILISHLHGDHFFGLVGLLSTMHLLGRDSGIVIYGPPELEQIIRMQLEIGGARIDFPLTFVPISGNDTKLLFEDRLLEIHTFPLRHRIPANGFLLKEKLKDRPLNGEKFKEDGLSLTLIPKLKAGLDVELEDGTMIYADDYTFAQLPVRSYAYCSDTVYLPEIAEKIKGVSCLYHEATFLENMRDRAKFTLHSTAGDAAKIALAANAGRLLLGHLSARYTEAQGHLDEASPIFPNVTVVEDGDVFTI